MGDERAGADAVRFYLSGGVRLGASQYDPGLALGGYRGCTEVGSFEVRRVNPIVGLVVEFVSGECGVGHGALVALGDDVVGFRAPWGVRGAGVTIGDGETKVVEDGDDGSKYVRVRRVSSSALSGAETLVLLDLFDSVVGMDVVESAEAAAGDVEYRGLFAVNVGALAVSNLTFWIGDVDLGLGVGDETPGGDGSIQVIADEGTAPAAVSFNTGTSVGTGLVVGGLSSLAAMGIWLRRTIGAGQLYGAKFLNELKYSFDYDSVTYLGRLRGHFRVSNGTPDADGYVEYNVYRGVDVAPDFEAAPFASGTTLPITTGALTFGAKNRLVTRGVNRFGLETANVAESVIELDGAGELVAVAPSGPSDFSVSGSGDGYLKVSALYAAGVDGANRGDVWVVYATFDGTDPDPDVDAALFTLAMLGTGAGIENLEYVTDGQSGRVLSQHLDGTPLRVVVRVRRSGTPDRDSENVAVASGEVNRVGPGIAGVGVSIGRSMGLYQVGGGNAPGVADIWYVDEVNDIRFEPVGGSVAFYGGAELIWRCLFDSCGGGSGRIYMPRGWGIHGGAVSWSGNGDAVEVGSWTGGDKRLYVNVPVGGVSTGVMEIDVTNKRITLAKLQGAGSVGSSSGIGAVWSRWDSICFMTWDPGSEGWVCYWRVDSLGVGRTRVGISVRYSQVEIEGL